ncbi:MAG: ABC transporter ATP-binding protein [Gammaproteobacteria bacterium]
MEILRVNKLDVHVGDLAISIDLNLSVMSQDRWCLLGRNGVGKTTLLHSLIGLYPATSGEILIEQCRLGQLKRRELAKKAGILFQDGLDAMPATVLETVMLGRHPHVQSLLLDTPEDLAMARACLRDFGLEGLADRQITSLSGGERQRLALARLLAQQPRLYLLDEPSNHLDIAYQVTLQKVLQARMNRDAAALIMATHDINLAARFCDHFLLLNGDGTAIAGTREEVLTRDRLAEAFECRIESASVQGVDYFYPA